MLITKLLISFIGVYGLIFGSFFSVVIDRALRRESVIFPSSHCPHCLHNLNLFDLVPLFSYIFLRGKCRYCKNKISPLNPLIECLSSLGAILIYINTPTFPDFLLGCGLFSLLLIVTVTDLKAMIIPNKVIIFYSIYFLIVKILYLTPNMILLDLIGCLFGFLCPLCVWVIYRKGIGFGDIKLFGLLGFVLGPHQIFICILFSCLIGVLSFLFYVLMRRMSCLRFHLNKTLANNGERKIYQQIIPFAPFIAIGAGIAYILG